MLPYVIDYRHPHGRVLRVIDLSGTDIDLANCLDFDIILRDLCYRPVLYKCDRYLISRGWLKIWPGLSVYDIADIERRCLFRKKNMTINCN